MRKLLSANFARLWKDKTFWLGVVFMFSLAVFVMVRESLSAPPHENFDMLYFGYSQILGFCCAVFTSLFLGVEYSDGTIRNKITVGHSRARIYLANLITVFSAMLLMAAAWLTGAFVGYPFLGPWVNIPGCAANLIASIFTTAAFSAIFTLIAMLTTNKAASAVQSIILFMGLSVFAGSVSYDRLRDFLPTGHAWIADGSAALTLLGTVSATMLGSVVFTAAATCAGILLFQKKDLK